MPSIFLDASALLAFLLDEPRGPEVAKVIAQAGRIVVSRLLKVEAERTFIRLSLDHPKHEWRVPGLHRELAFLWSGFDVLQITPDICDLAERIAPRSRLRALDAIHVATYYTARGADPAIRMLSFDARILECLQTG